MKDYEVCILINGKWEFEEKLTSKGRKAAMQRAVEAMPLRKNGTIRVRVLN